MTVKQILDVAFGLTLPIDFVAARGSIVGMSGAGKALALDTPLPTPSGWTSMREVCVGDLLIDELGTPCRVTWTSETQVNRPCYAVRFDDGSSIIADGSHRWLTETLLVRAARDNRERKHAQSGSVAGRAGRWQCQARSFPSVVTTEQIRASLMYQSSSGQTVKLNHSVVCAAHLSLPTAVLPIDPYVLGVWLGDGTSATSDITFGDQEIEHELQVVGLPLNNPRRRGHTVTYRVGKSATGRRSDSLESALRHLGVLRNKHIPPVYLRSSYEQRLALLQGLMDSDGSVGARGARTCEFYNKNERLTDAVYELVASLGWKARKRSRRARLYGVDHGVAYMITFVPNRQVFRIVRKAVRLKHALGNAQFLRNAKRMIVDVDPVASVPVRCLTVDSPSNLFLAGKSFIPTHNSNALRVMIEAVYDVGAPFVLADPLGASYGLRSSADGQSAGLSVPIFGGYHSDEGLRLTPSSGVLIARELYHADASAVLDLSALGIDEGCQFIADFNRELLQLHLRKKKLRSYFADEAPIIMPEQPGSKAAYAAAESFALLHQGGRAQGIGLKTATQSSSEQAKNTMKQSEIFIALRTMAPLDQKPIVDYLRTSTSKAQADEVRQTLSGLADGEAWFIAPRWIGEVKRATFHLSRTFDSSYTPKLGEIAIEPKVFADVDLARIREAIEREEAAAKTEPAGRPVELDGARVRELEAELERLRTKGPERVEVSVPPPQDKVQAIRDALNQAQSSLLHYQQIVERIRSAVGECDEMSDNWSSLVAPIASAMDDLFVHDPVEDTYAYAPPAEQPHPIPEIAPPRKRPVQRVPDESRPGLKMSPGVKALVETVRDRFPMKLTPKELSVFSGRSLKSSAWDGTVKGMLITGLVTWDGERYALSERGITEYGVDPHRTSDPTTVRTMWRRVLPPPAQKMLDALAERGGYDKDQLAARVGISPRSSGLGLGVSSLLKNGLIEVTDGRISLAPHLL